MCFRLWLVNWLLSCFVGISVTQLIVFTKAPSPPPLTCKSFCLWYLCIHHHYEPPHCINCMPTIHLSVQLAFVPLFIQLMEEGRLWLTITPVKLSQSTRHILPVRGCCTCFDAQIPMTTITQLDLISLGKKHWLFACYILAPMCLFYTSVSLLKIIDPQISSLIFHPLWNPNLFQ